MELTLGWRFGDKQYLECKFSDETHEVGVEVRLDKQVIPKRRSSKYQGFVFG